MQAVLQREGYNLTDLDMKKLRGHIHGELDERIMLDEFCTRLLDWSYLQKHPAWRTLLRSAFDELDVDGDGFISVADVTKIFTSPDQSAEYRTAQVFHCWLCACPLSDWLHSRLSLACIKVECLSFAPDIPGTRHSARVQC